MKTKFAEHFNLTPDEYRTLWSNALIVLDTNILLGFYRYNQGTLQDFYSILQDLKGKNQLWLPNWVAREFFNNRIGVIKEQREVYDKLASILNKPQSSIRELQRTHAYIDLGEFAHSYIDLVKPLVEEIAHKKASHPDYLSQDDILSRISEIYTDDIIGESWPEDKLFEVFKEGYDRYADKIPPGFRDSHKLADDSKASKQHAFGDLIIWKQILDEAKKTGRSIIFVSDDVKDDWIMEVSGKNMGALPALKRELRECAKVEFIICNSSQFLNNVTQYAGIEVSTGSIENVEETRKADELRELLGKVDRIKSVSENLDLYYKVQDLLRRSMAEVKNISDDYASSEDSDQLIDQLDTLQRVYGTAIGIIAKVIADDAFYYNSYRLLQRIKSLVARCQKILDEVHGYDGGHIHSQKIAAMNNHIIGLLDNHMANLSSMGTDDENDVFMWPG